MDAIKDDAFEDPFLDSGGLAGLVAAGLLALVVEVPLPGMGASVPAEEVGSAAPHTSYFGAFG